MRKAISALCLYLLAAVTCMAKEPHRISCGELARPSQSVLKLTHSISLVYVTTYYELCAPDRFGGSAQLLVLREKWTGKKVVVEPSNVVALDNANYEQLVSLLNRALKFNTEANFPPVVDGTSTCLETQRSCYLKVCFWDIEYQTEAKGLSGMVALSSRLVALGSK